MRTNSTDPPRRRTPLMDRYIGLDAHASSSTVATVGPSGPAIALPSGGDERRGADPGASRHPGHAACVSGGRHPRELAVRGALAPCGGDCGGGGAGEPEPEERQARCLRSGRTAPDRGDQAEGLQEAGRVRGAEASGESLHAPGGRLGAGTEPDQEPVPVPGCGGWRARECFRRRSERRG